MAEDDEISDEMEELIKYFLREVAYIKKEDKSVKRFRENTAEKARELGVLDDLMDQFTFRDFIAHQIMQLEGPGLYLDRLSISENKEEA